MNLVRNIFNNLNESAEVKKTYGDKPQEGKSEKLQRGKVASIPKGKGEGKYKVEKLQNVNKEAGEIYANDTDKVMDKIDSKEQSDKGKAASTIGTKADKTVKFPYGDKVDTPSDNKLIKECDGSNCDKKELKEDYDNGTWMKHQTAIENEIEAAKEEMDEDAFLDFIDGVINLCQNYNGELNQFESDKVEECGTPIPDSSVQECAGKECK